jgi:hypothetical protein
MLLTTDYRPVPFDVAFKSTQHFKAVYKNLISLTRDDIKATVAIESASGSSLIVQAVAVRALYWNISELQVGGRPGGRIEMHFDDGSEIALWVNGTRRALDTYRLLTDRMNIKPTHDMLVLLQDEDKPALLRHYAPLRELALDR